jgi:hypothetical protein
VVAWRAAFGRGSRPEADAGMANAITKINATRVRPRRMGAPVSSAGAIVSRQRSRGSIRQGAYGRAHAPDFWPPMPD